LQERARGRKARARARASRRRSNGFLGLITTESLSRDKRWEIMEGCINEASIFSDLT
jgi:hypothetical protein